MTTYRDSGFLAQAFVNFICLLGWSPKNDREQMSRQELIEAFSLEGVNRSNAVVNFSEEEPFDPKAVWLNAEHIRALPVEELTARLLPFVEGAGYDTSKLPQITPLIRERIRLLREVLTAADFFFLDQLAPYDSVELIPKKGDTALALKVLQRASEVLQTAEFTHDGLEGPLRGAAESLGIKAGQMFEPIRVAACGRKNAPPLFASLEVLGRETCLKRIAQAMEKLKSI
ncbi:Glutamate--tRNA ligase (fragment) [Candidatus Sulfopaludibacter sp. SbA3]